MYLQPAPYHGGAAHVHVPVHGNDGPAPLSGILVDTIEVLGEGELNASAARVIADLWDDRIHGGEKEDVEIAGLAPCASVACTSRGGMYPVMFATPHWRLQVSAWGTHRARLIASAETLASQGVEWFVLEAQRIEAWLWGVGRRHWRVSRIDLAVDFVGTTALAFADLEGCVTRAVGGSVYHEDGSHEDVDVAEDLSRDARQAGVRMTRRDVTSVTLGSASSRVQMCIYDKVKQCRAKQLAWALTSLTARGWDGEETVTRIEARFRSRALDDFPQWKLRDLGTLTKWQEWAPALWAYATRSTVRYCVIGNDSNRSRWDVREDWKAIAAVGGVAAKRIRAVSETVQEERRRRASRDLVRAAERLAAENEATTQLALDLSADCVSKGQPAILGLIAAVLTHAGPVIEQRALPRMDAVERAAEIAHRVSRRRKFVIWHDEPTYSMRLDPRHPMTKTHPMTESEAA